MDTYSSTCPKFLPFWFLYSCHCIQHSRFTKQDGWILWDLSLGLDGNIAITCGNKKTHQTSIDVYSVRNSESRDKPKIFYSKEFEKYVSEDGRYCSGRFVSFVDSYGDNSGLVLATGVGNKLELFDLIQDRVLKSRKVTLVNRCVFRCLSVRGRREIFIGFWESNKITVYDVIDLNEIKSIILQGIQDAYSLGDMTAIADRIFVCVGYKSEESNHRSLIFEGKNGRILSELTKPTDTHWYTETITVSVMLGVVAVVWCDSYYRREGTHYQIIFYSLLSENISSFLIVEIESGVSSIRISDRGDRMVTGNPWTGEVKLYDMAEVFTYDHLKKYLQTQLQNNECLRLANFFALPKDQADGILKSDTPTESLFLALEEKGVLLPSNVDRLTEAFLELRINSCYNVANIYQKTRGMSREESREPPTSTSLPGVSGTATTKHETMKRHGMEISHLTSDTPVLQKRRKVDSTKEEESPVASFQQTECQDEKADGASLYAEAFIDKNGGTLFLCEADISLHVPAGALTEGCTLRLTVPLDPKVYFPYSEVLPRVTPLMVCEPDNLLFQLPVKLTLPHCIVIKNPDNHAVTVKFGHRNDVAKGMTWLSEDAEYSLSEHYCSVFLNHFSGVDVGIDSTEEKILRVIPYTKLGHNNKQVLTVWLCNDLESDFQSVMQSEEKNEGLPLDSYDTFRLRCDSELEKKLKVSLEVLEGSSWRPDKNETKIDVKRLLNSNKSKCSFQMVSDGNEDENYMYFLLKVTQAVEEEERETTFALRKRTCDLKMPVKFTKPFSQNKQTSHLFPTDQKESLRPYTAVVYMDPVKHFNDDVIITLWLLPFDSTTEMFQGLQEEQELQYKHQVDTENSFSIVDDKPAIVTKTQFLNGHWCPVPEEMKIETDRIRFGSRAKFQFIGKRDRLNGSEYIELQVETFQVGEEKIRFITDVELNQLLYEIRQRKIEELKASANRKYSNSSSDDRGNKSYQSQIKSLPSTSSAVVKREHEKQDAVENVPPSKTKKKCKTPEDRLRYCFMVLKKNLAGDWKDLGRCLNSISDDELIRLSKEHKDDIQESTYQMLLSWKRKNGSQATPEVLIEALNLIGRRDLAEKLATL